MKNNINEIFDKVAPMWPLQSFIACNSLQGFDNLNFKEAILQAAKIFQKKTISPKLQEINLHTIKWARTYLDLKQSVIRMPSREMGFFAGIKNLMQYDDKLHKNKIDKIEFIKSISDEQNQAIEQCFEKLDAKNEDEKQKIMMVLVISLSGFAGHIKYRQNWDYGGDFKEAPASFEEYIALRLLIACLIVDDKKDLLDFFDEKDKKKLPKKLEKIEEDEKKFQEEFFREIKQNSAKLKYRSTLMMKSSRLNAQMVFCIDVRSHNIRKAIEAQGSYETYGFAGFFGVPVALKDYESENSVASCPVLLKPQHVIIENSLCSHENEKNLRQRRNLGILKGFYQSLKYSFTTPFALAEAAGLWCGLMMSFKTFSPKFSGKALKSAKKMMKPKIATFQEIDENGEIDDKFLAKSGISLQKQCEYGLNSLKMMGLCDNFAKIVVLCGHGAETENNAYASSLDCGACGARHGGSNAKILAAILNRSEVREFLAQNKIEIPDDTLFIAGLHNTTTDEVKIYKAKGLYKQEIAEIEIDLKKARDFCGDFANKDKKSKDWSQTRPEWGLATNAAFVIGPRILTQDLDLKCRSFLHSYNFEIDEDGKYLEAILTAPMIVAHWINSQYFFSAFDNVAYGSGSKITQNITNKMAAMQGNASDLMSGLPLQSVFESDKKPYHQPMRLNVVVHAPTEMIDKIIAKQEILQKLFKNEWIFLFAISKNGDEIFRLNADFSWGVPWHNSHKV
jgi:uncharacterized protein YbcC (UPF0753/DUF2309 family)